VTVPGLTVKKLEEMWEMATQGTVPAPPGCWIEITATGWGDVIFPNGTRVPAGDVYFDASSKGGAS